VSRYNYRFRIYTDKDDLTQEIPNNLARRCTQFFKNQKDSFTFDATSSNKGYHKINLLPCTNILIKIIQAALAPQIARQAKLKKQRLLLSKMTPLYVSKNADEKEVCMLSSTNDNSTMQKRQRGQVEKFLISLKHL
jgi:predicted patatin/cPLA2 family phospholipase